MILGNKLIAYNKTIAVSAVEVLEYLEEAKCATMENILNVTKLTTTQMIFSLDFLFAVDYILYVEGKICLKS